MKEEKKKVGFTIGKFAPLHKGHQSLIEKAIQEMDKVIVVVYDTEAINISTTERAKWIKELYPSVEVIEANKPPTKYGLDKESVEIQMKYLEKVIEPYKNEITHFYSNEPYGEKVAEYMQIENINSDLTKQKYKINATAIRNNLEENKQWMDEKIYQYIKKEGK